MQLLWKFFFFFFSYFVSFSGRRSGILGGTGVAVRGPVQHTLRGCVGPFGGAAAEGMGRIVPQGRAAPQPWDAAGQLQHRLGNDVGLGTQPHHFAIATHLRAGEILSEYPTFITAALAVSSLCTCRENGRNFKESFGSRYRLWDWDVFVVILS